MAINRYDNATATEKGMFTSLLKSHINLTGLKVSERKLEGSLTRPKVMFFLKNNNPAISHIEFVCDAEGTVLRMRVITAKHTKGSEFYEGLTHKLKGDKRYGGIVINWEAGDHNLTDILTSIGTLAEASEEILEPVAETPTEEKAEEVKAA